MSIGNLGLADEIDTKYALLIYDDPLIAISVKGKFLKNSEKR